MKKISKGIKKCMALCLTAAMLMSTAATVSAEETTAPTNRWTVSHQNNGSDVNAEAEKFGAVGKTGIRKINLKTERWAGKTSLHPTSGTVIPNDHFVILDVNVATNEDGLTLYSQPGGNLPLIKEIPLEKGQWHAVRLVVEKPMLQDDTKTGSVYLAKHKVYVDGKLAGKYTASGNDVQRNIKEDGTWNVDNKTWGVSVGKQSTDKYIYAADLRVSSAAEDPGPYSLPAVDANAAFKVLNGNIFPTSESGVTVSNLACTGGTVTVTDTTGAKKEDTAALAEGDRIVVYKDQMFNTYFYKPYNTFAQRDDWSGTVNKTNATTEEVKGISGKASTDSSVYITNTTGEGYLTIGDFKDIAGADYIIYEANIKPTSNLQGLSWKTNRSYSLSFGCRADALATDCWNKVICVVSKNEKNEKGEYKCEMYINGDGGRINYVQKVPGDTVPYINDANPEIPVTNIRLNFTPSSGYVGDLAYVDDVKVYEACYKPEIAPYTVTDSENAVYDKDNNMMYATSNAAIATACDATLASEGNGWVIVNRGNENYSKYNVRTFTANTISRDGNEFWGKTTSGTTAKDKFIAATYDASGRLTSAQLIDGTSIGGKILKCTFEPTESSRLFFWNFENLRPHAQSLNVTVSE